MENFRKIKVLTDRKAEKQHAQTEMQVCYGSKLQKSTLQQPRQSMLEHSEEEEIFHIKNLDTNRVESYSMRKLEEELLGNVNSLPEIEKLLENIWEDYLTDLEKEEEQFLEACYQGDAYTVKLVVSGRNKHPIDPRTALTDEGKNGIHLATISGSYRNTEIINLLLSYGVDINGRTKQELRTPLMLGCILGNDVAVRTLLENKAEMGLKDYEGNTALHHACIFNHRMIVKILLEHYFPMNMKNDKGMLAYQCISGRSEDIVKMFGGFSQEENDNDNEESLRRDEKSLISNGQEETETSMPLKSDNSSPINQVAIHQIGLGDFKKVSLLGRGAFGEVYLVQNTLNNKKYAMKVLDKSYIAHQNILRYAMTERKILSTINHPFIVSLHFAFQTSTKLYLTMDYCPGGDLLMLIKRRGRLDEINVKKYVGEIVLAIETLHRAEILYRDLKPSNIIIDEDGHACLTDFGLSKEASLAHSFCGSTAYLAPEMLWRRGHTKVLDWYLLGVLIYECLMGRPPFWDANKEQLIANIKRGSYKKLENEFSIEVRDLVEKLLRANSNKRLGINGAKEVKEHPWFTGIDWGMVERRELEMENLPEIKGKPVNGEFFVEKGVVEEENPVLGWDYLPRGRNE